MCTVSRPGLAAIASATAVELLVSLLCHPEGYAPLNSLPGAAHQLNFCSLALDASQQLCSSRQPALQGRRVRPRVCITARHGPASASGRARHVPECQSQRRSLQHVHSLLAPGSSPFPLSVRLSDAHLADVAIALDAGDRSSTSTARKAARCSCRRSTTRRICQA
jgi:hypothetical protein